MGPRGGRWQINSVIHRKRGLVKREWTQEMDSRLGSTTDFPWDRYRAGALSLSLCSASQVWGASGHPSPEEAGHCHAPLLCSRWKPETHPLLHQHQFARMNQHPSSCTFLGVWAGPPFKMKTAPPWR